jgi:hypothetical protein
MGAGWKGLIKEMKTCCDERGFDARDFGAL